MERAIVSGGCKKLRESGKLSCAFLGSQCPHNPTEYEATPFIDVCVRAEGEEAFVKIVSKPPKPKKAKKEFQTALIGMVRNYS